MLEEETGNQDKSPSSARGHSVRLTNAMYTTPKHDFIEPKDSPDTLWKKTDSCEVKLHADYETEVKNAF